MYYGTFYRYRPTFIRPVKYGNTDSKSIINIDLQYLNERGFKDYIVYAKLVNAVISGKPVYDIYNKAFLTNLSFNEEDGTIKAYIPLVWDYNDGKDHTFETRLRGIGASSDGTIYYYTLPV